MRYRVNALFLAGAVMLLVACADRSTEPAVRKTDVRANYDDGSICRSGYVVTAGRTDSTYTGCEDDQ